MSSQPPPSHVAPTPGTLILICGLPGSGKTYRFEIVWLGHVKDDQIVSLREFYNPIAVLKALEQGAAQFI